MADLLIKGMEMPKDEYVDVRIFKDGRVIANQADANEPNSHYANFTAIAVPPYGRLIDADKFITELRATINKVLLGSLLHNIFVNDESVKQDTLDGINFVLNRLENAPTVLEAST